MSEKIRLGRITNNESFSGTCTMWVPFILGKQNILYFAGEWFIIKWIRFAKECKKVFQAFAIFCCSISLFTHQVKKIYGKRDVTKPIDWSLLPWITTTESHLTPIRTILLSLQMNALSQPAVWLLWVPSLGKAISSKNSTEWSCSGRYRCDTYG